ncbi:peptidase S8 [Effusibacillus lacus]|uniref:Peptidase S8 n=1 Tax=Effusibacillus lacus TaxID=1348429 RepID=A0A292YSW4_9BACL|nr:serine protease AprX [Effusibacillus lacus]GAX91575.1 peptidase S8 [Effusibacillus lacus]
MKKKLVASLTASVLVLASITGVSAQNSAKQADPAPQKIPVIADLNKNKLFDNLEELLVSAQPGDRIPVIVMFNQAFNDHSYADLETKIGAFAAKFKYDAAFHGFAAELTKGQIDALQKMPFVKQVEYDMPVEVTMNTAKTWFGSEKASTDFGLTGDRDGNPTSYSKNDVVVAIIDTGIDGAHADLDGGKIIGWKDLVNNQTTPYDDNGHGTHVGGIVAGTGEGNAAYKGVAPGAALVGIKVLDKRGSGSMSTVDAGINWAIQNKDVYGIKVINLSLGTSGSSDGTDSTSTAVNTAFANGILPVVAAGNSGPARYTIGSPGAATDALTVGAFADVGENGFNVTDFSSRGPTKDNRIKPDIMAPGFNITAPKTNSTNLYITYSGTSMATPFTAGVAALMLDANYALTPADLKTKITGTAQDWGPAGQDIDYGHGRLQAYEAIKSAGGFTGTGPVVPNHSFVSGTLTGGGTSKTYSHNVTSVDYPVATTLIIKNWTSGIFGGSPDFDLYVYNPSGTLVGQAEGTKRQELVTFNPTVAGTYTIKVYSYSGSGDYLLDVSSK